MAAKSDKHSPNIFRCGLKGICKVSIYNLTGGTKFSLQCLACMMHGSFPQDKRKGGREI